MREGGPYARLRPVPLSKSGVPCLATDGEHGCELHAEQHPEFPHMCCSCAHTWPVAEHQIEIVGTDSSCRWKCSCGAGTSGRWFRGKAEAEKRAKRHLRRAGVSR